MVYLEVVGDKMEKRGCSRKRNRTGFQAAVDMGRMRIYSEGFLGMARKLPQYFTRARKMPFTKLVLFMMNMVKSSIQVALDRFFEKVGPEETHMSQQAYSKAREKLRWEAFRWLFEENVGDIYDGHYDTWHGYRVSATDGSKMQLPDDEVLRGYFGTMGSAKVAATAQASALYDVYNDVLIDVQLEPLATDERTLALRHIEALCATRSFGKELIIYDRGYASFELIGTLKERGISFLMRARRGFNKDIDRLAEGDHDAVLRKKDREDISVRVIKFTLPSGEEETLITDIGDKRMGIQAFKELYFKRWPVETKFDQVKNKLQVENFSGRTVNAINQDFFVCMYMSNIASLAIWEAQADVDGERLLKDNKYDYHVNANHAIGTLKDRFIMAILEENPRVRSKMVGRILYLLKFNPEPTRPNRSIPRNPVPRKAKYRHNRKSNC